ncbi:MAG: hypothetical protein GAK35_01377 [Herbaspirillum frisingense]|uniref:CHAD domain-containing protein n=1 Tax=Herbaspirillum frisingense TaxID=92645 RepID=A0A7V8FYB5_9BURK|nr:MAG: hypothetical protein GAK35_01377 [Herbaspirillum frisingense]
MERRRALLDSLVALKGAHEQATVVLSGIMIDAVRASKGSGAVPQVKAMRAYRKAIKTLKIQCLQVEMVLAELDKPGLPE